MGVFAVNPLLLSMGQNKLLLVFRRSTVRGLLRTIRKNALAPPAGLTGGIPEFFEEACSAVNKVRTKPRQLSAMPMAWSRWTSDTLPAASELNAIFELADRRGWLTSISGKQGKLVTDLSNACESRSALGHSSERRAKAAISDTRSVLHLEMEAAWHKRWNQKLRRIAESLALSMEEELNSFDLRSLSSSNVQAPHFASASVIPPHLYGAHAFEFLVYHFVHHLQDELAHRQSPIRDDSFIQPHAGWPETMRRLAGNLSNQLNRFASSIEAVEDEELSGGRSASNVRSGIFAK